MQPKVHELGDCRFELLSRACGDREEFLGLGTIWIGQTQVRCGRLPLAPETQTFPDGLLFDRLWLIGVEEQPEQIRIRLSVSFRQNFSALMRDHSFDPIHDSSDWHIAPDIIEETLDLVLRLANDEFNGVAFTGFSYHYEYSGQHTPLFTLLDKASWELDGDIEGATAVSQSSCSAPVATFETDTVWSTEGVIFFDDRARRENPVMTHNLPRWASHGSFDFQYKGDATLIGVFERVELIRSLLKREAGKAELKCFDKHLFDQALQVSTSPKKILLNTQPKTNIDQHNLWTWIQDEVYERARGEFGLNEEPIMPRLSQNFWVGFSVWDYNRDLLPAAINLGIRQVFVDNLNHSDLTCGHPTPSGGNMCCGHEYELAPLLGGAEGVRSLVAGCREHDIEPFAWTNNAQSYDSPLQRDDKRAHWFVKMEDSRLKYGGAYSNLMSIFSFKQKEACQYWVDSLKKIRTESGLSGYLFDSFYNLGFMPIDYGGMAPKTQWRELLSALKELQEADVHFLIESFGPFGQVQHGCPQSYNFETLFACYKIGLGSGYTTVPGGEVAQARAEEATQLYRVLAHMTTPPIPLFVDGERIDRLWSKAHKQALADYHANLPFMHRRYLQEDGAGVLWHDRDEKFATLWNFKDRVVRLDELITDVTLGERLQQAGEYSLSACHTYRIEVQESKVLPRTVVQNAPVAVKTSIS